MRLLLVEDDPMLGMLARDGLVQRGFFVDLVATVADARHAIAVAVYDAVILDRSLPDGDGLELAGGLARSGTAVLFATAQDSTSARIAGLDAGGDDYIIKPYDLDEVAARIRAATRKPGPRNAGPIVYGPLTLDASSLEAVLAGEPIMLGRREWSLLAILAAEAPATVIRDRLEERLYAFDEPVTPNALDVMVSRLRRRLAPAGLRIESRRGIGWRMVTE